MSKVVDVISRKTAVKTALASEGNLSVSLHEPSVVMVHASTHDVARYERAGKDLLIHMKDGSVIRCNGYFIEDSEQDHGELVFQDDATQTLTHVEFADTGDALGIQSVILHPTETALVNLEPLMLGASYTDLPWGMIAAGLLGGGAIGALLASGGHDSGGTTIIDNTKDVEVANPTFLVSDKQGDNQGLLTTNAVTDETQPTFTGTGQPGASIQVKDANGNVIASAQVKSDGTWSAQLPAQDAGSHTYSVVQVNGDKTTSAGDITLNIVTAQATLSVGTVAGDNVLNAAEHGAAVNISGQSSYLASGTSLTVTLNGKSYTTTVGDNGAWSLSVPQADAALLADGVHTIAVSGKDAAGNTISGSQTLTVDTHPPSLSVNTLSGDDMISAAESGQALVLSGTTNAEAGQKVILTLNGQTYEATVKADGSWSTSVPSADVSKLTNGDYSVTATVSDKAGNSSSAEHSITADITVPTVSIGTIAGDNVINALEHLQAQTISGSSTGAAAGDKVTVTLNGQTYTTLLDADGNWSVGVPADVIKSLADGSYNVSVNITDKAGNTGSHSQDISVSTQSDKLAIDTIAQDDVINAAEKGQDLALSGTSNLADGTVVTVTLNGSDYTAKVSGGQWTLSVPTSDVALLGEARYILSVSITDSQGNETRITHGIDVDSALPKVTIDNVTSDNILNAAEVAQDQDISGHVTHAAQGDIVTITIGGKTYETQVDADLNWKITVPSADLKALGDDQLTITASVTNGHGNTGEGSRDILIDANLPGLRISTVAGDDIINTIEHGQNLIVKGTSTDLAEGSTIYVTINGVDYQTSVMADGSWSTAVPADDVSAWQAGPVAISARSHDASGNPVQIGHTVTVDLNPVAISINSVTADNVVNAAEKGAGLELSGTTQNVEPGQTVTVQFSSHSYKVDVDQNGNWSVNVPAIDMANLKDGDTSVSVSVTNVNGNSVSATQGLNVDSTAPDLFVNNITEDNILNAAQAGQALILSGTSTAEAGQTVTIKLNGVDYTAKVEIDGNWSTTVQASDLAKLSDGSSYSVEASVSDKAGNSADAARDVLVDVSAPVVTIDITAGDNIINAREHSQAQIISGSSTGTVAGDKVTVTIGDHEYITTVDASGNWIIGVPAGVIKGLAEGDVTVSASITDKAGNTGSHSNTLTVNTVQPELEINALAVDNVLNTIEKGEALTVSGTSAGLADNTVITVNLGGINYTTTVNGGQWSLDIPVNDLAKLGEANYTVTVSATSDIGNDVSNSATLLVDSRLPSITVDTVTSDNVLNANEIATDQVISGKVSGAAQGDTVTVIIGGKSYETQVESDLSWKVTVTADELKAFGDGDLTITASVTNDHGNTGSGSREINIDANLPGLRVNTVAGDDVINAIEHGLDLMISGTSTDLAANSTVTVTVNGVDYQASVKADGTWSVAVPAADVSAWPEGPVNISAAGSDVSNNDVNIGHDVTVDLSNVAISIDSVTADNVLNAAEKGAELTLSGSTQNVETNQTVTVQFAGHTYTAQVDVNGNWSVKVPAADMTSLKDGDAKVNVSVTNVNGNSAAAGHELSVDATAPQLSINNITADNILNAAEAGAGLTVSGNSTAEAGQTVTVTLNGVNYTATVQMDGRWSTTVPAGDLAKLTDGSNYDVEASVSDKAGNSADTAREVLIDVTAPVVSINVIAGDDVINATEHVQAQIISGSSTGTVAGDTVTVTVGGETYVTRVDTNGNWSIGVPASVIQGLADNSYDITASITDKAGNTGGDTHAITVNTHSPTFTINTITGDNVINETEKTSDLTITGNATGLVDNAQVTVNLNGINYLGTVTGGVWSVNVPATDLAKLGEANYQVTVSGSDIYGNNGSQSQPLQVASLKPGITVDNVTGDDVLNAAEIAVDQTISGKVTGAAQGDMIFVSVGGVSYQTKVESDLSWKIILTSEQLSALGNGPVDILVSVTDVHGNTGIGSREVTVDANLPGLRINTVAGDNFINAIERHQDLMVTGTSSDLAQGSTVIVTIQGTTYQASVMADGSWSAVVPSADVMTWPEGGINIQASGKDTSGNPVTYGHVIDVDMSSVAVSIDSVTADNVLNAAEKGADLTLSGATQNVEANQTVTVQFAGHTYSAQVDTNGNWSVNVPAADMVNLKDGDTNVVANVTNVIGNSASASHELSVDASAPQVAIDNITADNVLNAAETAAELTLTGTSTAEAGQVVTIKLNGVEYTATVQVGGIWSTTVPATDLAKLTDGNYNVEASVSDKAGNSSGAVREVQVDITAPVVTINTVAGDDVINAAEHAQAQIISGGSIGAAAGDRVTVTIDGNSYVTYVDANGKWSIGVPADVIKELADNTYSIDVSITDAAGNTGSKSHNVDVMASKVTLSIDTIAQDDVVNAAEKGQPLTISGDSELLPSGTQVTVTVNDVSYTTTVALNGSWTLDIPAADVAKLGEGKLTVTVSASDTAGNAANDSRDIIIDSVAPTLSIETVSGDDRLNAAERGQDMVIKGHTSAETGQTVTVHVGNNDYTATVKNDGTWSLTVPAADLVSLQDGPLNITATVSDKAGNGVTESHSLMVDTTAPTLSFNTIAGDDIINSVEQLAGQTFSGKTDAEAGQKVVVNFNNRDYTTTVDANGNWKVNVPASDFLGATDGSYIVTVTTSDVAGNGFSDSKTITLSGAAPTISIDTFATDDIVSAAEHGTSHVISGTTTGAALGQVVTIELNGKTYTATVDGNGAWKYTLSASDVQALNDGGSYVINASVNNSIGNGASDQHGISVDTTAPSMVITIDSIVGDSGLSSSDFITSVNQVTMKGGLGATLGNDEKAQISLDGGLTWSDLQVNGTTWSYAQGTQLADGTYTYIVRVIDKAGNVGSTASQDVVIDTVAPDASKSISLDAISQDTGLDPHDFITSDNTLTVSGKLGATLAADEHAQISIDGGKTWVDVNISGLNWTYVDGRTLADGDYNYQLRIIDQAGNVGATANQVVTVDITPPDASKTISIDGITDDTGLSNSDFITSDQSLTVHGTLGATPMASETVQISLDGGLTWLATVVIGNQWSYVDNRTLTDGVHQYIVRVVDQAGNVGQTASQNVTVDTIAPDASTTISIDGITTDTGLDAHDFITSDTSLTLHGTLGAKLQAGEVAQVSMDNGKTWVTVTLTGTAWTYTDGRTLTDGSYTYQMRVIDQAGNIGQTTSQVVIVDTTAPTQTMTVDTISTDTGASASDFITSDNTLTLSGSFSAVLGSDERGQISLDGGVTWQFVNVIGKTWTFDDGRTLTDGVHHYQVRVIDTAGNVSVEGSKDVTIDTKNPDALATINTYTDDTGERTGSFGANVITDDTTPLLTGTLTTGLAAGEVLEIWRNGVMVGHATVNGTVWTFADTLAADGTYQYIAKTVDLAGNATHSSEFDLKLDTSIPTTTAAVNGLSTADTTPILTGTVSADLVNGQYVVVTVNGVTYSSEVGGRVVVDPSSNTWYLQVPDSAALALNTYDVTAQVKSGAGNGNNTAIAHGSLGVIAEPAHDTSWASTAGSAYNSTMTFGVNSNGLWNLFANSVSYNSSNVDSYSTNKLTNPHAGGTQVISSTLIDFDRNGTADIASTDAYYGDSRQPVWTFDGTNYTGTTWAMGTTLWYGGIIAYDKTGDGYLEVAYGDSGGDSRTYLLNNKGVMGLDGSGGTAGLTSIVTYRELSGIDINNDGIIDLAQHTNASGTNALSIIKNNGTGTFSVGQSIANVFINNASDTNTGASMTWADFNGDGYMDLYIGSGMGAATGGTIYYNQGNGTLSTTKSLVEASNASAGYISAAVDWNGDGQMDIIKLSTYSGSQTATLFTNNNHGASWSSSALKTGLAYITGIATMDYNWDGAVDLLVSQLNGKVQLIENTNKIAAGTAIHLRILDSEGINVFYGNTVQLFNSAGVLVASEVINAQSGIGTNDTSALVNFYGLDPSETYSAVLVRAINGVSSNATWHDLVAGDGKESYSLTADAATGGHSGILTGTGYNDTFVAESGTYTYVGSGGWETSSNHATWSATGGEDIVDFKNSTVGITADLSKTGAQNTGFNTSTFNGIEGIAGSNFNDVITGNSGNNLFEGRGGNDTFNIGSGGHDTLLYKLINSTDATGGNGSDTVNGFTVGTWEGTADTDRVDISELLQGSGYTGNGSASYVNGVATLDSSVGNITDFVKVTTSGSDTVIEIDRDGSGSNYAPTTVVTITGVHTDLATLLANHQLTVV